MAIQRICPTCGEYAAAVARCDHCGTPTRKPGPHRSLYGSRRWRTETRPQILERDRHTCQACGSDGTDTYINRRGQLEQNALHIDHRYPVSRGGDYHDPANLQVLCKRCNLEKSNHAA